MTRLFLSSDNRRRRKFDDTHRFIGRSFGAHSVGDDVSHPEKLVEKMKTPDGVRNLWDVSDQAFHQIQAFMKGAKARGHRVYAYYQIDDDPIERWDVEKTSVRQFFEMMKPSPRDSMAGVH